MFQRTSDEPFKGELSKGDLPMMNSQVANSQTANSQVATSREFGQPMSPIIQRPGAILETILAHLAMLFLAGAGGDPIAAKQAAASLLSDYGPETEDELCLAAQIVGFSFHALEALAQAATPDMPLNRVLRLRGGAVSLSRESEKAQRRLNERQAARAEDKDVPAETPPPPPIVEKALDLIEDTRTVAAVAKATGVTWTKAYQQRQRATRIAENLKKNQARHAALQAGVKPGAAIT
jgi:hypothetical protein